MYDLIPKGGRIYDGSGMPSFIGDVGIAKGRIEAIGRINAAADRVLDVGGLAGAAQQWKESQQTAQELGLQLLSMAVSRASAFDSAFKEATKARSGALMVTQNSLVASNQQKVLGLAVKNRLPAIYSQVSYVTGGGLMSYGTDLSESFRRVVSMVDRILKGTKPADIPVEAADEVRASDQSENGEADWTDDSARCVVESGQRNSLRVSGEAKAIDPQATKIQNRKARNH